jgi:iron complex transport system ATP-binding protein
MLDLVKQVISHGVGAVVVLHDLNLAARFADTVILMDNGKVVRSGSVERVFEEDIFSDVYGTKIYIERHDLLNRLVVHS